MKHFIKKAGFTLVETVLAITIIGLVITATAELTQASLRTSQTTIEQFMAYHLAQEGLELVRNKRDSNWLQNRPWDYELGNAAPAAAVKLDEHRLFNREVEIKPIMDSAGIPQALRITSRVLFEFRGKQREVSLTTELTDWKKGPL